LVHRNVIVILNHDVIDTTGQGIETEPSLAIGVYAADRCSSTLKINQNLLGRKPDPRDGNFPDDVPDCALLGKSGSRFEEQKDQRKYQSEQRES
jgi:hypothetical protein